MRTRGPLLAATSAAALRRGGSPSVTQGQMPATAQPTGTILGKTPGHPSSPPWGRRAAPGQAPGPRAGLGCGFEGGRGGPGRGHQAPPPGSPPRPRAPPPFPGSGLWAFVSEGPEAPPAGRSGPRLLGQLRIRLRFPGRPQPRAPRWSRLRRCSRDASCKCPQPCSARSSPRTQRRTDGRRGWAGEPRFLPLFQQGRKSCVCAHNGFRKWPHLTFPKMLSKLQSLGHWKTF